MRVRSAFLALLVALGAGAVAPSPARAVGERAVALPGTFDTPLQVTGPRGDRRAFVVERRGVVKVVERDSSDDITAVRTFADIRDLVGTDGEGGLLGLAFSPTFGEDGRLWVSYTDRSGDSRVDRLQVASNGLSVDRASRVNVLLVDQPASNHNGGMIAFGRDGMLLVGLGDGGGSGDPFENGQDTSTLLGSILRLDVVDRAGGGYAIPSDNPFVGRAGRDEIWIYGVRNPYRFSVDREGGDLWIGDVGQSQREEIDRVPYRPATAVNLGWDRWEGTRCFESCGSTSGLTFPVEEYTHADGRCSITGGHRVRSSRTPDLVGLYLYSDFCDGVVRSYDPATDRSRVLDVPGLENLGNVYGFGEDGLGDVYVMNGSRVLRFEGSGTRFSDVPASSTFAADIEAIADAGVTRGCNPPANTRFCPTRAVSRAEVAAFITRAVPLTRRPESFSDVAADDVFAMDIGAIAAAGITRGCNPPSNTRFCPDRGLTRAEMAALLVRARDLPPAQERFRDVASGDTFAREIGALAAADITRGCNPPANDLFCPDQLVTRQEMAAFLVRAFDL